MKLFFASLRLCVKLVITATKLTAAVSYVHDAPESKNIFPRACDSWLNVDGRDDAAAEGDRAGRFRHRVGRVVGGQASLRAGRSRHFNSQADGRRVACGDSRSYRSG